MLMTALTLKIIAAVTMLIDHIGGAFPWDTPVWFRYIGRAAFPIYAYFIANGCKRTKDIYKYMLRLGVFALISEIPFDQAFWGTLSPSDGISFIDQTNVFYTLFLGCAAIAVYGGVSRKRRPWLALTPLPALACVFLVGFIDESLFIARYELIKTLLVKLPIALCAAGAVAFSKFAEDGDETAFGKVCGLLAAIPLIALAGALNTDYGSFGVVFILAVYVFNPNSRLARTVALAAGMVYEYGKGALAGALAGDISAAVGWLPYMAFALAASALMFFYNGGKGRGGAFVKWAFYAFYPVHIAALAAVRFALM
jgi:hypothetical protein